MAGVVKLAPVETAVPPLATLYQLKGDVPDTVRVVVPPGQTVVLPVITGAAITVIVAFAVAWQPVVADVPVTVQTDVAAGVNVIPALLEENGDDHA